MLTTTTSLRWHWSTTSVGTPSPATNALAPPSMMSCTCSPIPPGMAVRRSTPKGLSVAPRTAGDLRHHLLVPHGRSAEAPESAGFGDRGGELGVRHAAHASQHHGMLDAEELGESRAHQINLLSDSRVHQWELVVYPPPGP